MSLAFVPIQTPVVFIIFNRPEATQATFREIARARPKKLLIVADGPRADHSGEAELCRASRKIAEQVDWDCEVLINFSETNLGCQKRPLTGINWAFEQVEEAIILEDDCVPDPSFFQFCEQLIQKYRDNPNVMAICGNFLSKLSKPPSESYYFSRFFYVWGWATWKRAWLKNDIEMKGWPEFRESKEFEEVFSTVSARWYQRRHWDQAYQRDNDIWDYQWYYSILKAGGYCICPTQNLIQNIGFGEGATHTVETNPLLTQKAGAMSFPIVHPTQVERNLFYDRLWLNQRMSFPKLLRQKSRELLSRLAY